MHNQFFNSVKVRLFVYLCLSKNSLKILLTIALLLAINISFVFAQVEDNSAEGLYFTKERSFGIVAHTSGWGFEYRNVTNKGAFKKRIKSLELVSIKNVKEVKVKNAAYNNSKGFVYGKLYNVWAIRPSYIFQKVIYGKEIKSALQISRVFGVGPVFYFCKPVFLDIITKTTDPSIDQVSTERYNPDEHTINEIYGRSAFATGIDKSTFLPGLFFKWGYQFDFTPENDRIKYLEIGSTLDIQPLGLQQMAFNKKQYAFLNLYLSFAIGKKMYQ